MSSITTNHTVNIGKTDHIPIHGFHVSRKEGRHSKSLGAKEIFVAQVSPQAASRKNSVVSGKQI